MEKRRRKNYHLQDEGMMQNTADKIEMMFNLMEYDQLSDHQHDLIIDYSNQFDRTGRLSDRQFEVLADIFKGAAEV